MRFAQLIALFSCATACSAGSFNGKVAGLTFTPKDAIFQSQYYQPDPNSSLPSAVQAYVLINSSGSACSDTQNRINHAGESSLEFVLNLVKPGSGMLSAGVYAIDSNTLDPNVHSTTASSQFLAYDSNCSQKTSLMASSEDGAATGGNVTVKSVDGSRLEGTFDLTFGSDHVTGDFVASNCSGSAPGAPRNVGELFHPYDGTGPIPSSNNDNTIVCKH